MSRKSGKPIKPPIRGLLKNLDEYLSPEDDVDDLEKENVNAKMENPDEEMKKHKVKISEESPNVESEIEGARACAVPYVGPEEVDNIEIPMNLKLLKEPPSMEDVRFDLSCVKCWKENGPPTISCLNGHSICKSCYDSEEVKSCPSELQDTPSTTVVCEKAIYGIDQAVKNTAHYKYFMEHARYSCGVCGAVMSGNDILKHEQEKHRE